MSRYVLTIQSHVAYGFVGNSANPLRKCSFMNCGISGRTKTPVSVSPITGSHSQTARELFTDKGCRVTFVTSLLTPDVLAGTVETLAVTKDDAWVVRTPLVERKPTPNGRKEKAFEMEAFRAMKILS